MVDISESEYVEPQQAEETRAWDPSDTELVLAAAAAVSDTDPILAFMLEAACPYVNIHHESLLHPDHDVALAAVKMACEILSREESVE